MSYKSLLKVGVKPMTHNSFESLKEIVDDFIKKNYKFNYIEFLNDYDDRVSFTDLNELELNIHKMKTYSDMSIAFIVEDSKKSNIGNFQLKSSKSRRLSWYAEINLNSISDRDKINSDILKICSGNRFSKTIDNILISFTLSIALAFVTMIIVNSVVQDSGYLNLILGYIMMIGIVVTAIRSLFKAFYGKTIFTSWMRENASNFIIGLVFLILGYLLNEFT